MNFAQEIPGKIIFDTGASDKRRLININDIVGTNGHDLCSALLGLHAFTGCDSNSSFMRKGKINPIKIMKKDNSFIQAFKRLGTTEDVNESDIDTFERFTCKLYGSKKKVDDLNTLRYTRFMSKYTPEDNSLVSSDVGVDLALIPPCKSSLILQIKREVRFCLIIKSQKQLIFILCPYISDLNSCSTITAFYY